MISKTAIANLALSHLGDDASITSLDPPSGHAQADHAAQFYPLALRTVLEAKQWSFATRTGQLSAASAETVDGWTYAYALPADCIKPLRIYAEGGRQDDMNDAEYDVETSAGGTALVLTDLETPYITYTADVQDTARFTGIFTRALSWLLASMIAGPLLKGETGAKAAQACMAEYERLIEEAAVIDANRSRKRLDHIPAHIEGR